MRICTFNVNSIRARLGLLLDWLKHRGDDIDVLCLQELKTVDDGFPVNDFQALGYRCELYGQKAYNGVAICSRLPVVSVEKGLGLGGDWDSQRRLMRVALGGAAEGITIVCVYAPHGGERGSEKYNYKLQWYEKFREYLGAIAHETAFVVGDFNVARFDSDVYDPAALRDTIATMPEERRAFENVIDCGFTDVHGHLHPAERQFTWWAYGAAIWKDQGMRIDYVLATAGGLKITKEISVDLWPRRKKTPTPSDHAPVIVELAD
ncbi:MAG: exodeoxyribonuclease III [Candidatus Magnetominusculus sp. LBB02]|nr:exodeoxyribonuclease III [Candidatus Magnetominusculus sp. LBB02]